uniref:N-terminal acetyltransferase B complex auxiliary subunit NAA25 n=1 Tax=Elaeis guineensis var. tenera TaxID=51953 RepID=A0A8N4IDS2_ELAGV|nr:N-terminal acetyltransferase B complex auxiliary subunit NAA25 [Elaeis guineensis]
MALGGKTYHNGHPCYDHLGPCISLRSSIIFVPLHLLFEALKALILEKMGKPDEALSVCLNAKELLHSDNVVHTDDLTLSTLQIVFHQLNCLDLATSCYEHACGKYPNNLEIMMGLFNCYVHEYSFVKQQQIAIKMYKIVGEERFLLWAVCSIQLQVLCGSGDEKLLSLAEGLLKRHISSHSLHEPEALVMYISILEQQAKYEAALEVLSGDLGSLITIEEDKLRMQGRLLARASNYAAAAEIFQKALESFPDDWESFLHYLGCLLEDDMYWSKASTADQICTFGSIDFQVCEATHLTEEVFYSHISRALLFVQMLQMDIQNDYIRGPFLAIIEIERRRRLHGKADDGKFMEAWLNYFHRLVDPIQIEQIYHYGMLFWRTKKLGYLLEATMVLEFGLNIRRDVWQYKVPLLHLYSHMGALPLAYEWYVTLELKNIQLETDSHHILTHMLKSPHWQETADLLKEYLKFMDDHLREAADLTFLAYRHRNYSKVIEFVKFKKHLQHSGQLLMARLEAFILQLKQKADNLEEVEGILENVNYGIQLLELSNEDKLKSLTFNGYLQGRPWWSPTPDIDYLSEPFEEGSACLREKSVNHDYAP